MKFHWGYTMGLLSSYLYFLLAPRQQSRLTMPCYKNATTKAFMHRPQAWLTLTTLMQKAVPKPRPGAVVSGCG